MKILIYGNNIEEIIKLAESACFDVVTENPDMVASVGGDGTFMLSEKAFPEVPKFILKKSKTSKLGHDLSPEIILNKIIKSSYIIEDKIKIEATSKGKKIVGLNEIIVHNVDPRRAIRYEIFINDKKVGEEIIGDGVVISTPYGSTGYYRSITDSFFEVGIGVAFNNSTEQSDHMVLKDDSEVVIKIIRGEAIVYADNNNEEIILNNGDEVLIKKYKNIAKIIKFI
jgi:NAD+ kinase